MSLKFQNTCSLATKLGAFRALGLHKSVPLSLPLCLGFLSALVGCGLSGQGESEKPRIETKKVTLAVEIAENTNSFSNSNAGQLNLADAQAPFIGLGIEGQAGSEVPAPLFEPQALQPGQEISIELQVGQTVRFKSRVMKAVSEPGSSFGYRYLLTDAETTLTISEDTAEVPLSFPAYREVKPTFVYGSVVENGGPAAGWAVAPLDTFTGAAWAIPGLEGAATTNDKGVFSFRYLFHDDNWSSGGMGLRFSKDGKTISRRATVSGKALPGTILGFLNLSGENSVSGGLSADDFDGDGYTNLAESAMGTNPFEINIGLCVDPGQVLSGFQYTCPNGAQLVGNLQIASGASCFDVLGDTNGDGKRDAEDCRGRQGAGSGIKTTEFATSAQCESGGVTFETWRDLNNNGIIEEGVERESSRTSTVCNGSDGADGVVTGGGGAVDQGGGDQRIGSALRVVSAPDATSGINVATFADYGGPTALFGTSNQKELRLNSSGNNVFSPSPSRTLFESSDCTGQAFMDQASTQIGATLNSLVATAAVPAASPPPPERRSIRSVYENASFGSGGGFGGGPSIFACRTQGESVQHSAASDTALLYGSSSQIRRTTDGGVTFTVPTGLPLTGNDSGVSQLIASKAGAFLAKGNNGTWYYSGNQGASFSTVTMTGWPAQETPIYLAGIGNNLYIGNKNRVMRSTNAGASLTLLSGVSHNISSIALNGTELFVSAGNKVFVSINDGANFAEIQPIAEIGYNPRILDSTKLYTYDDKSLSVSNDSGRSWKTIVTVSVTANHPRVDIHEIKHFAVAGSVLALAGSEGLAISNNDGASWSVFTVASGLPSSDVFSVAVSPSGKIAARFFSGQVAVTENHGSTWSVDSAIYAEGDLVWMDERLFANTYSGAIFTDDLGASWLSAHADLQLSMGSASYCGPSAVCVRNSYSVKMAFLDVQEDVVSVLSFDKASLGFSNFAQISSLHYHEAIDKLIVTASDGGISIFNDTNDTWAYEGTAQGLACASGVRKVEVFGSKLMAFCQDLSGRKFTRAQSGGPWTQFNENGSAWGHTVAYSGGSLFVGDSDSFSVSGDGGISFVTREVPLSDVYNWGFVSGRILAKHSNGISISADNGTTWDFLTNSESYGSENRLAFGSASGFAYIEQSQNNSSNHGSNQNQSNALKISLDFGVTWRTVQLGQARDVYLASALSLPPGVSWPFNLLQLVLP